MRISPLSPRLETLVVCKTVIGGGEGPGVRGEFFGSLFHSALGFASCQSFSAPRHLGQYRTLRTFGFVGLTRHPPRTYDCEFGNCFFRAVRYAELNRISP